MAVVRARPKPSFWNQSYRYLMTLGILSMPLLMFFFSVPPLEDYPPSSDIESSSDVQSSMTLRPKVVYDLSPEGNGDVRRYAAFEVSKDGSKHSVSIQRWATLMTHSDTSYAEELALNLTSILKSAPYKAFRFETKGCSLSNSDTKPFEFVLVNDPFLSDFAAVANLDAFEEHFQNCPKSVACVFSNLGGDATLVVPKPMMSNGDDSNSYKEIYGHCANFVRHAPESQIVGTWRLVAESYLQRLDSRPHDTVWLSTAGTGVAWLHFRLDDRPKYYLYRNFKQET